MRLDISEVLREVGKLLPYDIHEPPLVDEDVECTEPIQGRITFNNTGGTLLIRGKARTQVALPCSRCTRYFEQPVAFQVEEQFELRHNAAGPRTLQTVAVVEEDDSPIAGRLFDDQVFDLTEMLRQYILLDEPTQPLPPTLADGRCAHCHLRPEEVLQEIQTEEDNAETPIHPALAKLGQLLENEGD
ncbi:MAG TPA: DUF177 domain-containing protein [Chthonomonadaceae bacterium]|nr:DUF177 domain-containing protein [Chthonomonadaceae bacterium]